MCAQDEPRSLQTSDARNGRCGHELDIRQAELVHGTTQGYATRWEDWYLRRSLWQSKRFALIAWVLLAGDERPRTTTIAYPWLIKAAMQRAQSGLGLLHGAPGSDKASYIPLTSDEASRLLQPLGHLTSGPPVQMTLADFFRGSGPAFQDEASSGKLGV